MLALLISQVTSTGILKVANTMDSRSNIPPALPTHESKVNASKLETFTNELVKHQFDEYHITGAGVSMVWGSWQSAANPLLRDTHVYIMVFLKDHSLVKKPTIKKIQ